MHHIILMFFVLSGQIFFAQKTKTPAKTPGKTFEQKLELNAEQKKLFNANFEKFIDALKTNDKAAMTALLSEKAKQMVNDQVFEKLSKDINVSRKLSVFKTGYKSTIGGKNYPMIQYKYSDEKAKEPKEIITAVFEEDGKILGIKPYKQGSI